jgi:mono/diheme cytochrome c family protein
MRTVRSSTALLAIALAAAACGGSSGGASSTAAAVSAAPTSAPATTAATTAAAPAGSTAELAAGKAVFDGDSGCSGCHTLKDAGASATVGPDLDKGLKGKSAAFIRESIVAPDAEITPGYPAGLMPKNFGQALKPAELDALVGYLAAVTG